MKTIKFFNVLFFGFVMLFVSCSNDDDSSMEGPVLTVVSVTDVMVDGSWRISEYNDSGTDETSDFDGYNFEFFDDGNVRASNGTVSLDGIWSVTASSSSDDNSPVDFNLFFAVSEDHDFDDLNDNWDVMTSTNSKLNLSDISGGDGSTDKLIFSKN